MAPVGEGAIRVTTGRSDIELAGRGGFWGRPLSTWIRRAPNRAQVAVWLADQARAQADRWTLWTPVAFGCGAAGYMALRAEPQAWTILPLAVAAAGLILLARRYSPNRAVTCALTLLAFALAGFCAGKIRTERVAAPVMTAVEGPRWMEAYVLDAHSPGRSGGRVVLAPFRIAGLAAEATPVRVRVTLRPEHALPAPGETVRLLAILNPPPPPAAPGSYDFARDAWFESIGGVGFALGAPEPTVLPAAPWRLRAAMAVNAVRWDLARRIVGVLGTDTGGLAAAMVTGHEAFVPPEQVEAMRASGLAHIISISGLHMAIVGGFAFAAVRLGVALWPWLALRIHGKKAAALLGMAAVLGYLVISGAPPPAERAAITALVAFAAILADRRAISLHALAIAALIILALQPEAVATPGFQMSFAATTALVALAEAWRPPAKEINTPWPIRLVQGAGAWIAASIGASLVAGMATGPFAIQHFNRVASFGLAANLAVAPISSFVIMPFLALGAALTPLGLGEPFLEIAGLGIGMMTAVADLAAGAPGSTLLVPSAPSWALWAAFLGILWVCLIRGPLRWAGLPLALAVSLAPRGPPPDLWIASDGAAIALRADREAILLRPDVKLFGAEHWAQRQGLVFAEDRQAARDARFTCDRYSCVAASGAPGVVSLAAVFSRKEVSATRLAALCRDHDLVVVRARAEARCKDALVLDGGDFARGGAAQLWKRADGWRIQWAQDLRGRRPWSWGYDPR